MLIQFQLKTIKEFAFLTKLKTKSNKIRIFQINTKEKFFAN